MATRKIPVKRVSGSTARPTPAAAGAQAAELAEHLAGASTRVARAASRGPDLPATADLAGELNNIDFRKMIGGPLQACVDAQVASSLATVDFINKVGFKAAATEGAPRELVMVDFTHSRTDDPAKPATITKITIPLLAMLPIPSLRIEHVIIDFNVKLNSVQSASASDELGVNAEVSAGWGPVSLKVSASYQRKTATNVEVKKEYSLNVNVKAVQDEMPAGLEKILNMLAA
jgi:Protein of unknown function (DUF2589)